MDSEDKNKKAQFQKQKDATLNKEDLSRKGSIDEPIQQLVEIINASSSYYTTSTCSGRITLTEKPYNNAGIKKGSIFHLNSHDEVRFEQFNKVIQECAEKQSEDEQCLWLKFEPFIMHIQCYDLERARILLNIALANGCRNSGITLGKPNKFMLAIRSTSSMEVPISCGTRFILSDTSYYQFLCQEANRRFQENSRRLLQLEGAIKEVLE